MKKEKLSINEILLADLAVAPLKVLLHCCCAPCAGYVVDLLHNKCELSLLYYNPNITDSAEYALRYGELAKLAAAYGLKVIDGGYDDVRFLSSVQGREQDSEGGARCEICIGERLRYTAKAAKELGCDRFMTTLTVSPRKNAALINSLGQAHDGYLASDFKKNDGYKRSVEICGEFGFYRQNYCGCEFSRRQH